MPKVPSHAVAAVALAIAAVTLVPPHGPDARAGVAATEVPSPSLTIDPDAWWMETGSNVTLAAAWDGTPPGCSLQPTWFRWSIAPGGSEGTLGASNGSSVTFSADVQTSGTTTVVVRSGAVLRCPGAITAEGSGAAAAVAVAAPLTVRELSVRPNPVAPGTPVTLTGSIVGGSPPYQLRIAWGDGSFTGVNLTESGGFSASFAYETNGSYAPSVDAGDAAGTHTTATVMERVNVSGGFVAAIAASTLVAEVGVPVKFQVQVLGAPRNFSTLFGCENSASVVSPNGSGLSYDCIFNRPQPSYVSFEAVGARLPFPVAYAALEEPVMPALSISLEPTTDGEVGGTLYAGVTVVGGVPPFVLHWALVGTGTNGSLGLPSDGPGLLPLSAPRPGSFDLSVTAADALGQESVPENMPVAFLPLLALSATAEAVASAHGMQLNVSADAYGGVPPFDWTIVPSLRAQNGSPPAGTLVAPGGFAWNGTFRAEGTVGIAVVLVDAVGGSVTVNLTAEAVPVLAVTAVVQPAGPDQVTLELTITGGVGPYAYRWADDAGDEGNGTAPTGGTLTLHEPVEEPGPLEFTVAVTDALGATVSTTGNTSIPAPAVPGAPGSVLPLATALLGLVGAGAAATVGLRRRGRLRKTARPTPPDPETVLREVIEPSDGVDRALVEMLAEERGLGPEVVRETLERLKAEGRVRTGRGFDGEEVFAWVERAPS